MGVSPVELRTRQLYQDFLDQRRYLVEHTLELVDLLLLLVDVLLYLYPAFFVLGSLVEYSLFFLVVLFELIVFGSEVGVDVDEVVDFLVEYIDVGEQIIVLFFSFDEGVLYFLDVGEAGGFLDGIEGLVNDLHVPLIIVDQFHFLFVVHYQFGQALLQDGSSVVLDSVDFSCFDSAAPVESGVF